jgi:exopolysaccharide production protein ExoZ
MDPTRGLAILLVLLYHALGYLRVASTLHGEFGVDAFLLLSGFLLAYGARPEPGYAFLGRRLLRLIPAYWLVFAGCMVFDVWRGAHSGGVPWKHVILHLTCLHLAWGDPYAMSINMSFWFMGLIVPLYIWFAMLRPWILRGSGYAALGVSLMIAAAGSALLMNYADWGPSSRGHAPFRIQSFFIGAVLGLAYGRRDLLDRIVREPWLLLGLTATIAVPSFFRPGDWLSFPFYLTGGIAVVSLGAALAVWGERWKTARVVTIGLTAVGAIAFELYLCHQYVLISVNEHLLEPWVASRFPKLSPTSHALICAFVAIGASFWVAYLVRWIVAPRESRKTWRITVPALAAVTALVVGGGLSLGFSLPRPKYRVFQVTVEPPHGKYVNAAVTEPIFYLGVPMAADLLFLEHNGHGHCRIGIDHWGAPATYSGWLDEPQVMKGTWQISVSANQIDVRAGQLKLSSRYVPYDWRAKPAFGRNDVGFTGVLPTSASRVTRVQNPNVPSTRPSVPATAPSSQPAL